MDARRWLGDYRLFAIDRGLASRLEIPTSAETGSIVCGEVHEVEFPRLGVALYVVAIPFKACANGGLVVHALRR